MPNSLLITIFIISVLGSAFAFAYIISLFKQDISVIKAGIFGITGYFFLYVLISSVLFFFDFYSISKAVLICFVPVIGFSVFSLIKIKKFKKIKFSKKELIFFLAIVLSAVLLSGNRLSGCSLNVELRFMRLLSSAISSLSQPASLWGSTSSAPACSPLFQTASSPAFSLWCAPSSYSQHASMV